MSRNPDYVNIPPLESIYHSNRPIGIQNKLQDTIASYVGNSEWVTGLFGEFCLMNQDSLEDKIASIVRKNREILYCIAISRNGEEMIRNYFTSDIMTFETKQNASDFKAFAKRHGKMLERQISGKTNLHTTTIAVAGFLLDLAQQDIEYEITNEENVWLFYLREMLLVVSDIPEFKKLADSYTVF